ncbi:hypothetical protein AAE478_000636 [Parahypoxylon ruwenzoriense]
MADGMGQYTDKGSQTRWPPARPNITIPEIETSVDQAHGAHTVQTPEISSDANASPRVDSTATPLTITSWKTAGDGLSRLHSLVASERVTHSTTHTWISLVKEE